MPPPGYVLTTVETPASSYALTTLATIKSVLQIADNASDSYLNLLISQASATAAQYCNRVFAVETLSVVFRLERGYRGSGLLGRTSPLQLPRWPLTAIASIETLCNSADTPTTLVESVDFEADYTVGQLFRLDMYGNPRNWEAIRTTVAFSAGYTTTPPDLEAAVIDLVKMPWFARTRDPLLRSDAVEGVGTQQFWIGAMGQDGAVPPAIASRLDNYRVPVVA